MIVLVTVKNDEDQVKNEGVCELTTPNINSRADNFAIIHGI